MKIYNVYQSGKRLYIDEKENPDNKIVVNKYENMQQTLRLISDGTLPPRLYWALRNPKLSNKYFILPLINNEDLVIDTSVTATPGLWDLILVGTPDDYIIEGTDIDQSKLTYISDTFSRLFVRDNYLEELDIEEQIPHNWMVFYDEIIFQLSKKADSKDIPDKMSDLENDTGFISGVALKDDGDGNVEIVGTTFNGGETEEGGGNCDCIVDSELSETSTNPVQNAVVTKEVIALKERNAELEETIEKLQIKTTTDSSSFHHITDSANMKVVDFGLEGKTEQETTPGNQLFDKNAVVEGVLDIDGSIISGNGYSTSDFISISVGEAYYCTKTGSLRGKYFDSDKNPITTDTNSDISLQSGGTFIVASDNIAYIRFSMINEIIDTVMFNKGTTTLPYEPFTNGPSPNPDYPQEIVNAGVLNEEAGRYEIDCRVTPKNIWYPHYKPDVVGLYTGWRVKDDESQYMCVTLIDKDISVDISGIYFGVTHRGYDPNTSVFWLVNGGGINKREHCSTQNYLSIYTGGDENIALEKLLKRFYIMVEYGRNFTSYTEPEEHQPFTLTSPVPLTKWDYKAKRDGIHGWSINSINPVLNGTEHWVYFEAYNAFYIRLGTNIKDTVDAKCSHYLRYGTIVDDKNNIFKVLGGAFDDMVWIRDTRFNNVEDFKAWLSENNVMLSIPTVEEQAFIPLPDDEQILLNNLETYYGVTNVYNEQGCPMWLTYVNDNQLYIDNKLEQINNALLSLGANV